VTRRRPIVHAGHSAVEANFPGADSTAEELEFLQAIGRYKRQARRPQPTWREALGVVKALGYRK